MKVNGNMPPISLMLFWPLDGNDKFASSLVASIRFRMPIVILAQYPDLALHTSTLMRTCAMAFGYHYSHASIIRRSLDHFGLGHELIQYGIRSGTREEYQFMKEHKTVRTSRKDFLDSVAALG